MNLCSFHKIRFERPDLDELIKQYTVVDLHFHSKYSDGNNAVSSIAKRALELGIGIAITDHNEIKGAVEIDRYRELLSIPGIEITSREGTHLLIYFYEVKSLIKLAISEFPNSKKLCKNMMILGLKRIFSDQNNSGIRTSNS